jgi:pectate lyase
LSRNSGCITGALLLSIGCSSAPTTAPMGEPQQKPPTIYEDRVIGWAAVNDLGQDGTTGGEGGELVDVTSLEDFVYQAGLEGPRVILLHGVIGDGSRVTIASHKTVLGAVGAEFHGGLRVDGGFNVIIRNLKIVGNNCSDVPVANEMETPDCSRGADAVSIGDAAHHVWVDHCDISDGSDGNLDVNDRSDYVTVSWTKFSYSGQRRGRHQFSNLVGGGDGATDDAGHLRVTYHHNWWAENIQERMPRVRFGQVHVFNSLYTAVGNSYCVGVGVFANILTESNAFVRVQDPIQSTSYSNEQSVVVSRDNLYIQTSGQRADKLEPGAAVFVPPYPYTLQPASQTQVAVESGAGPCVGPHVFTPVPPTCTAAAQP